MLLSVSIIISLVTARGLVKFCFSSSKVPKMCFSKASKGAHSTSCSLCSRPCYSLPHCANICMQFVDVCAYLPTCWLRKWSLSSATVSITVFWFWPFIDYPYLPLYNEHFLYLKSTSIKRQGMLSIGMRIARLQRKFDRVIFFNVSKGEIHEI